MSDQSLSPMITCDGPCFKRWSSAGLAWLEQNAEIVNKLNVFPVPDGDTGTNMLLTMQAAYRAIAEESSPDVGVVVYKLAQGALMGSRGNSGTILSQLLRGLSQIVWGQPVFTAELLAEGFHEAVKMAYHAVQNPVEGTILTVARETAEEIEAAVKETDDLRVILERAVIRSRQAVARTPDQLPILKKAGVVDSGGQGFAFILEGILRHLKGESLIAPHVMPVRGATLHATLQADDARGYPYDVQYIVRGKQLDIEAVRADIGAMGDSMVVVGDDSMIKVHIHVYDPGVPLSYGVKLGVISDIVVENMQAQSEDYIAMREETRDAPLPEVVVEEGDIAVVAVVPGLGLNRVFRDLGTAAVVAGGQTMNPSTEELLRAIESTRADKVVVLPNNKNVVLSAELAAQLAQRDSHKQVAVIPTRTIPQGITAMLSFSPNGDFESVVRAMDEAREQVATGEITAAVRNAEFDGMKVSEGEIIGLADGKLVVAARDLSTAVKDLLEKMSVRDREVVTLYYGEPVRKDEANKLADILRREYPGQEFDVIEGGQPRYHFIISAE